MKLKLVLKRFLKRFFLINSFCKECGDSITDFNCDNQLWKEITKKESDKEFCYRCFCLKANTVFKIIAIDPAADSEEGKRLMKEIKIKTHDEYFRTHARPPEVYYEKTEFARPEFRYHLRALDPWWRLRDCEVSEWKPK